MKVEKFLEKHEFTSLNINSVNTYNKKVNKTIKECGDTIEEFNEH